MLIILAAFLSAAPLRPAVAKETWIRVRSKHFLLIGNASEREIRRAAIKLEQFREVFSRLFASINLNSPAPTTVIVFKNDSAYRPFKPLYQGKPSNVAGTFQSGEAVNYITLAADRRPESPYATIFHEYVHLLTKDNLRASPLWLNEGLAEYYSTFEVADGDRKVWLGKPLPERIYSLREGNLFPLRTLFAVGYDSPHYNEQGKQNIFYAQSWALVHYLLHGQRGQRRAQLQHYLTLLAAGASAEESFQQAFQTDYGTMERELEDYIRRHLYPVRVFTLGRRLEFDAGLEVAVLSEAEAQFYLGDLLRHSQRLAEAEGYLQRAIALDAELGAAYASLGMLRVRQKRFAEARRHLQRAVAAKAQSYLAHYYYAYALSRESMGEDQRVAYYEPEAAETMRAELRKAIELEPNFPESYHLLAFVNLVMSERLEESESLLKRALELAPGRQEFAFVLAQVYLRQQNYEAARRTIEPLAQGGREPDLRAKAQSLLGTIAKVTERMAELQAERKAASVRAAAPSEEARAAGEVGRQPLRLRFEGAQVRGLLLRMDCHGSSLTLTIKAGERILRLHSETGDRVFLFTYTKEVDRELTCGPLKPAPPVLVTYQTPTGAGSKFDGEPVAVEFEKPD
jgi:tetratricopeptide (TPR) repeat protein